MVDVRDWGDTLGHYNLSLVPENLPKPCPQLGFCQEVRSRAAVIKNVNGGILVPCSCNGKTLSLSVGEIGAGKLDFVAESIRQAFHKVFHLGNVQWIPVVDCS